MQKSAAFLNTGNEQYEKEIKKTTVFTTASKRTKYLGINVAKEMDDLSTENSKALLK